MASHVIGIHGQRLHESIYIALCPLVEAPRELRNGLERRQIVAIERQHSVAVMGLRLEMHIMVQAHIAFILRQRHETANGMPRIEFHAPGQLAFSLCLGQGTPQAPRGHRIEIPSGMEGTMVCWAEGLEIIVPPRRVTEVSTVAIETKLPSVVHCIEHGVEHRCVFRKKASINAHTIDEWTLQLAVHLFIALKKRIDGFLFHFLSQIIL